LSFHARELASGKSQYGLTSPLGWITLQVVARELASVKSHNLDSFILHHAGCKRRHVATSPAGVISGRFRWLASSSCFTRAHAAGGKGGGRLGERKRRRRGRRRRRVVVSDGLLGPGRGRRSAPQVLDVGRCIVLDTPRPPVGPTLLMHPCSRPRHQGLLLPLLPPIDALSQPGCLGRCPTSLASLTRLSSSSSPSNLGVATGADALPAARLASIPNPIAAPKAASHREGQHGIECCKAGDGEGEQRPPAVLGLTR
jgi:hypothetical protein